MNKWIVCGSQSKKEYRQEVYDKLDAELKHYRQIMGEDWTPIIIEGECADSADIYARDWAIQNNIPHEEHPVIGH